MVHHDSTDELPALRFPLDHYRLEVHRRASGLQRRRLAIGGGILAAVVAAASLVTWQYTSPGQASRSTSPAGPSTSTSRPGTSVVPTTTPSPTPQPTQACYYDSACVEASTLLRGSGSIAKFYIGSDGALFIDLVSTSTLRWGLPTVTGGQTVLKLSTRHSEQNGSEQLSVFIPTGSSGTATVTVSCSGSSCTQANYPLTVNVTPGTPLKTIAPTPPGSGPLLRGPTTTTPPVAPTPPCSLPGGANC